MFKNVLVGVDGRPNGRDAIAFACKLIDPDGNMTLAHVHGGKLRPSRAIAPGMAREERESSHKLLEAERAAADVQAQLLSIESVSPGRGLHEQAEEHNADLLVVGSCSHGAFGRVMLGDDTRAALNGAPCAVAVAPRGYAEDPHPIDKVGVGYNASPESKVALAVAHELAAQTGASVHALEVVWIPLVASTGLMPPGTGESIDVMIKEAKSRMKALPDVEGYAVYGLTGEELAVFGNAVDILIVGSRDYGPMRHQVIGSTSAYLQRHARCPLLVLPRAATPSESSTTPGELQAETTAGTVV
jgi:nucleotide-binding universal stress UspA family protein